MAKLGAVSHEWVEDMVEQASLMGAEQK